MANHREYYKTLVAANQNDKLIRLLLEAISWHKTQYKDAFISAKYDELLLLSARNEGIGQASGQGILTPSDAVVEENKINLALLALINDLPEMFFRQISTFSPTGTQTAAPIRSAAPRLLAIPAGLGTGLYWVMACFFGMVSAGTLIQENWITFALTAPAVALCVPPFYEWVSARTHIKLSNSLRILLILALMAVGLSYAKPSQTPGARTTISNESNK